MVSVTQIRFLSGAYAGLSANLDPNHSGRTYIDVLLANGYRQSYEYLNPEPSPST